MAGQKRRTYENSIYNQRNSRPKRRVTTRRLRAARSGGYYPSISNAMIAARRRTAMPRTANFVDTAYAAYAGNTTGSIAQLNIVAQGASQSQRVGKKILMKSLQVRGLVQADSAATVSQTAWMIVYDKRPAGALPAITDILNTISPNSFLNDAASARFLIVHRWSNVTIGNSATPGNDAVAYNIDEYIKLPKRARKVTYTNLGTGAIGDVDSGALYLITVGGSAAGASDSVIGLGFRLRYWDIAG